MKFGKGYENYTKEEQARIALGRQVASEGMVLLENNGALPLKPDAKVALFGVGQIGFLHVVEPRCKQFGFPRHRCSFHSNRRYTL